MSRKPILLLAGLAALLSLGWIQARCTRGEEGATSGPWTRARVSKLDAKGIAALMSQEETSRSGITKGLIEIAQSTERSIADRRAAIDALGRIREPAGLAYCLENIRLSIPEVDMIDSGPYDDEPCFGALVAAGWCSVPLILNRAGGFDPLGDDELASMAIALRFICRTAKARALVSARLKASGSEAKKRLSRMLDIIGG